MKGTGDVIDPPNKPASAGTVSAGCVGTTAAGSEIVGPFLMKPKQMGMLQQMALQPPHILGKGTVGDQGDNNFGYEFSPYFCSNIFPWAVVGQRSSAVWIKCSTGQPASTAAADLAGLGPHA